MLHKLVDKSVINEMLATLEGMASEENKIIRGSHNGAMLRLAAKELREFYGPPYSKTDPTNKGSA